ncbi:MAG: ArnT family glycosyltransferase [Candidatus Scalindua sp.]
MINSFINLFIWFFLLVIATGIGLLFFKYLSLKTTRKIEVFVLSAGLGFVHLTYGITVIAWLKLLNTTTIYVWLGILTIAAVIGFQQWRTRQCCFVSGVRSPDHERKPHSTLWLILGIISVLYLLCTMTPPLDGDTLHSYLDVPRRYVYAGGFVPLPFEPLASQPLNMQMLSALALLIRGDELSQMLVGFTMCFGAASTIYLLGRRYFSVEVGLWAALFFLITNVVESLVPTTKVNLGNAFFDLLGFYAVSQWAFSKEYRNEWLLTAGIFVGTSCGCMYTGGFTAIVLALFIGVVAFVQGKNPTAGLIGASCKLLLFGLPVIFLTIPWMVKNYVEINNPVYPLFHHFFTGKEFFLPETYDKGLWSLITNMWAMSTRYAPWPYGNPIGPVFLALLPGIFFFRPLPKPVVWILVSVGLLYLLYCFVGVQRPRNFLTGMGLLSVIAAGSLVVCKSRFERIWRLAIISFTLLIFFEMAFFAKLHFISLEKWRYLFGVDSREKYLERAILKYEAFPNWEMVNFINGLPRDEATIVSLYVSNDYYINPEVNFIDTRMVDGVFFNNSLINDPQSVLDEWSRLGVQYIFVNELYLRDKVSNAADYKLVQSPIFRENCLQLVKQSGQQYLYRLTCNKFPKL